MGIQMVNIGFGNVVSAQRIVAMMSPESAPIRRVISEARGRGMLIDATYGRRTRAVIVTDSDHVILSAVSPETVASRLEDIVKRQNENKMKKGKIFVITAPSGCGKGTLRRALLKEAPSIQFCPSLTTRAPRPGEVDGVDYIFVSREDFLRKRDRGELIEWAEVYGNLYGTPKKDIEMALSQGRDVILEKDVQGARTLRKVFPEGIFIFILPPSFDELKRRMEARGTESEEDKRVRLESARDEIADLGTFDYVIINSDVERAKQRLLAITVGERMRA